MYLPAPESTLLLHQVELRAFIVTALSTAFKPPPAPPTDIRSGVELHQLMKDIASGRYTLLSPSCMTYMYEELVSYEVLRRPKTYRGEALD